MSKHYRQITSFNKQAQTSPQFDKTLLNRQITSFHNYGNAPLSTQFVQCVFIIDYLIIAFLGHIFSGTHKSVFYRWLMNMVLHLFTQVGQGTYSSVFRARDLEAGRIVALKKVRFDNFEPESVLFMAREILILRRLNHPNIMKLEGIITSQLSCSIYLVFEYMEHDISGLLSCPDINFTESQVCDM